MSFKNLQKKKTETQLKEKQSVSTDNLPKDSFTFADFFVHWKKYISLLEKQGNKILSSILNSSKPLLKETIIQLTYPNNVMITEVKKNQTYILNYLRDKLQNYDVTIQLILDENEEKKYAYTPQEKYNKLREINPVIDKLRVKLHLDI